MIKGYNSDKYLKIRSMRNKCMLYQFVFIQATDLQMSNHNPDEMKVLYKNWLKTEGADTKFDRFTDKGSSFCYKGSNHDPDKIRTITVSYMKTG